MVRLEPKQHRYFDSKTNIEYESVTKVIHKFVNEFDAPYWSDYKALKDVLEEEGTWSQYKKKAGGWEQVVPYYRRHKADIPKHIFAKIMVRKEYYLTRWKTENKEAVDKGSKFHDYMEKNTVSVNQVSTKGKVVDTIDAHNKIDIMDISHHDKSGVYTEVVVYNNEYGIAGTMDRLEKFGIDIWIHDYKTNKEIKQEGFRQRSMKPPLIELQDCNYSHYLLQLSTYGWIMEEKGYKVKGLVLEHVPTGVDYAMPYRPDLVVKMLKAYRKTA